jgi:hypothetical protein
MNQPSNSESDPPAPNTGVNVGDISDVDGGGVDVAGRDIRETSLSAGATYIEKVEIINNGITDLSDVLRKLSAQEPSQPPAAHTAALGYKTDFSEITRQIREMNNLKRLHDAFHHLQPECDRLREVVAGLPGDARAWEQIIMHRHNLEEKIKKLLRLAEVVTFSEDVLMFQQFKTIIQEIDPELYREPQKDSEAARGHIELAISILGTALTFHPRTIDTQLYNIVRALELDKIVAGLVNIQKTIAGRDQKLAPGTYFQLALQGIPQLAQDLKNLSEIHNCLQSIVHELYRIQSNLTLKELSSGWSYLNGMNDRLAADKSAEWIDSLNKARADMTQSIASNQEWDAKICFWAYRSLINNHFQDVDGELLDLTNQLGKMGGALDGLLQFLEDQT